MLMLQLHLVCAILAFKATSKNLRLMYEHIQNKLRERGYDVKLNFIEMWCERFGITDVSQIDDDFLLICESYSQECKIQQPDTQKEINSDSSASGVGVAVQSKPKVEDVLDSHLQMLLEMHQHSEVEINKQITSELLNASKNSNTTLQNIISFKTRFAHQTSNVQIDAHNKALLAFAAMWLLISGMVLSLVISTGVQNNDSKREIEALSNQLHEYQRQQSEPISTP